MRIVRIALPGQGVGSKLAPRTFRIGRTKMIRQFVKSDVTLPLAGSRHAVFPSPAGRGSTTWQTLIPTTGMGSENN